MRKLLMATALAVVLPVAAANAALITSFAQESGSNTITSTNNGAGVTTIDTTGALVTLGGGLFNVSGVNFDLSATSTDTAVLVGTSVIQHYSGNFCISSGAGCTGSFLSGTFTDAAFGANGGPGLTVNVNNPPESLALASNVLPASELQPPSSFNLTFVNLSAPLGIVGGSIDSFTASFTGDISASAANVPEPTTMAVLGMGMLGLGMVRARRRRE